MVLALAITAYCPAAAKAAAEGSYEAKGGSALAGSAAAIPANTSNEAQTGDSFVIDPASLNIKKLGQDAVNDTNDDAAGISPSGTLTPADIYGPDDIVRVSIFMEQPSVIDAGYSLNSIASDPQTRSYRAAIRAAQNETVNKINARLRSDLDIKWNLTLATNAVSANVRFGDIIKIASVDGVRKVIIENQYEPPKDVQPSSGSDLKTAAGLSSGSDLKTAAGLSSGSDLETAAGLSSGSDLDTAPAGPLTANTSQNMTGAAQAWADGYTGAGSKVAIIDTGADTDHQAFNAAAFEYSLSLLNKSVPLLTSADVDAVRSQLNGSGGRYMTSKIPFAYNYVDRNTTVNHLSDNQGEHGSHVAGIATANRYIRSGSTYVEAASNAGAVGMAPDAQLIIMKVFGSGGGAYDSDYMAAIEDAIVLGCDAVNLSLGSSVQGFTFADGYQDILNKLTDTALNEKLVVSISAGNSYAFTQFTDTDLYIEDVNMHTGGSPGTYINSLCVAAAYNTITTGCPLVFNGSRNVFYDESTEGDDGTAYSNPAMTTIASSNSYTYVYIDALGTAADYSEVNSAVSLSGKIVIVNRGDITFSEKGNNVKNYSPKALIVANNQSGTILMNLADFTGRFPMVSIKLADANAIKAGAASSGTTSSGITYYTGPVRVTNVEESFVADRRDATVTEFSSWGIPGSLIMKPEITAPGGNIYSVNGTHRTSGGTAGGTSAYEYMSGTSMAAPHITGLSAVVAQYLRENDIDALNPELIDNYSIRAIVQSLLMSTATPMQNDGEYVSLLQQGAGLADVSAAVRSRSVLMLNSEDDTLTAKTGAAADGKVKAELGDDPEKTGSYTYSFTLYNLTGASLEYELTTELFTQVRYAAEGYGAFMDTATARLPAGGVSYSWNGEAAAEEGHDVDRDGDTDNDDVQAILDYVAGNLAAESIDLAAADVDNDGSVTSRDAYLLIDWEPAASASAYILPANGTATVTVTINLTAEQRAVLDADYPCGTYLQGFTYARCVTANNEHEHSIPILGFYGSWTDPSMFDNTSYVDTLYGTEKIPYTGNSNTNYIRVEYNGVTTKFSGNPYKVEPEFPSSRLALNSNSKVVNVTYNLVRAAGTTGYAASKLDALGGNVTEVLAASVTGNEVDGVYFDDEGYIQNSSSKVYAVNKNAAAYGLTEGDVFRVGFYAIPEYNAMLVNDDYSSEAAGILGAAGFRTLLLSNVLGRGAFVGYDFVIDDTEPVLEAPVLSGSSLTISASDNLNLAYVAVLSLDGGTVYAELIPGSDLCTATVDISQAIANAHGYVAVFAADYAGNEVARALKVNDNTYEEKTVYVLTSALSAGGDYLIVSRNSAGSGAALGHSGSTVATNAVTVKTGIADTSNTPYIDSVDVADTSIWTVSSGYKFKNGSYYLARSSRNALQLTTSNTNNSWSWDGTNNRLSINSRYLRYNNSSFSLSTTTSSVYLYIKTVIRTEVDPFSITSVSIVPDSLDLYKGNTADLAAKVLPLTATDRTVSWSSSNSNVATVDAGGHVKAVAAGTATITATANGNTNISASVSVKVTSVTKSLNAIVWDADGGEYFSSFNANALPAWSKLHNEAKSASLNSAFMADSSTLYAGSLNTSQMETKLYTVNRSGYALTEYGTNYVIATDMARASTRYTGYFVYSFAGYLVFGNLEPEEDDEGTFSGYPYGLLEMAETSVGDAYVAAVAAASIGTTSSTFYFLDENGIIWSTKMNIGNSVSFGSPTKVVETGISTSFLYQSLYYDGSYLFWTHTDGDTAELIIIDPSTKAVYHAGDFGADVWPVTGIYVNGAAAPASLGFDTGVRPAFDTGVRPAAYADGTASLSGLKPVATRSDLLTGEVLARYSAEAAKFKVRYAAENEALDVADTEVRYAADRLTDTEVRYAADRLTVSEPAAADLVIDTEPLSGQATLIITESEDTINGLIEVRYDAEKLAVVSAEAAARFSSIFVDEESGVIKVGYADNNAIPADDTIATIIFEAYCTNQEIEITTRERNEALGLSDGTGVVILGKGHDWTGPDWTWTDDLTAAEAAFVCANDPAHTAVIPAEITVNDGTGDDEGYTVYTAAVTGPDGNEYTDTRKVIKTYTITWKNWDGTVLAVDTVQHGQVPQYGLEGTEMPLKAPDDKFAYEFASWYPVPSEATQDAVYEAEFCGLVKDADPVLAQGELAEGLTFSNKSLTLYSNLSVKYKINAAALADAGFTNAFIICTMNNVVDGQNTPVAKRIDGVLQNGVWVFEYKNIAPQYMATNIYTVIFAETADGTLYRSGINTYSVREYCVNILNSGRYDSDSAYDTALRTLLVDILNYGTEAQNYVTYRTADPASLLLTPAQAAQATGSDPELNDVYALSVSTVPDPRVTFTGKGLYLDNAVRIRYKIHVDGALTGLKLVVNAPGLNKTWTIKASSFKKIDDNGNYYVYFSGLNFNQMDETVTAVVKDASGNAVSETMTYSITSYIHNQLAKTDPPAPAKLVNLLRTLAKLNISSNDFVEANKL